jgi:hypothetical protein
VDYLHHTLSRQRFDQASHRESQGVLAVAGTALIVEALFGAFGLIPEERKAPFEAS